MTPSLPNLPKASRTVFFFAIKGSDKSSKTDLIRCNNCYLTVHQVCYGIHVDTVTSWLCDRCEAKSFIAVSIQEMY